MLSRKVRTVMAMVPVAVGLAADASKSKSCMPKCKENGHSRARALCLAEWAGMLLACSWYAALARCWLRPTSLTVGVFWHDIGMRWHSWPPLANRTPPPPPPSGGRIIVDRGMHTYVRCVLFRPAKNNVQEVSCGYLQQDTVQHILLPCSQSSAPTILFPSIMSCTSLDDLKL